MNVNNSNNEKKISFGYNATFHKSATKLFVEKFSQNFQNTPKINMQTIQKAVVKPDDVKDAFEFSHCANFTKQTAKDAFAGMSHYLSEAISHHKNKNYEERDKSLGYALHFLQDMTCAVHFQNDGSASMQKIHNKFENYASTIFLPIYNETNFASKKLPFNEFCNEALNTNKELAEKIAKGNDGNLLEIVVKSVDNTFKTMEEFFQEFSNRI